MIQLNLQTFAKTASEMAAYRSSHRIVKQDSPGQPAKLDFKKGRLSDGDIRGRDNYVLYEVKDENDSREVPKGRITGEKLRDMIAHEKIEYNKRQKLWVTKKGKYVVRTRP